MNERLLAGPMDLPHRWPQPPRPLPVDPAELGVAVAVGMDPGVLLPEEAQRDAVPLQLPVDVRAVGSGSVGHRRRAAKQPGLERRVVEVGRQRPAQPVPRRPLQIAGNRARTDDAGLGYLPVGQPLFVPESENLPNLPHQ